MCGICGKASLNKEVDENLIRKMCKVLNHRGPDNEGVYLSGNKGQRKESRVSIGLGHRRLSIIDLSPAGNQPMCNEDGKVWVVMNGEIYNFMELRAGLQSQGHVFKSNSDTEVILHLYEEKGIDCLEDFRGPFAFAIWDENKQRLFIARDRIGKKPFYYIYNNQTLIFASEIKAILQDNDVPVSVNRQAITDYLSYGYVPTPDSMFEGIMKLPPAHLLIYEKGEIRIKKYWELDFSKKVKISERECSARIMELLEDATRIRLVSDVPLGVFLSGGIDSSAIVYMANKLSREPLKTFSIGFDEEKYNELKYARIIAKRFKTDHNEYIVKPNIEEVLPKLIWHYNEPYADSSALPTYYVAKMSRQEVTVALTGDGGDEDFGGYERFMAARYAELINRAPLLFKNKIIKFIINRIPESLEFKDTPARLRRFLINTSKPYRQRHYNWITIFSDYEKENLFTDEFNREITGSGSFSYLDRAFDECGSKDVVDLVMSTDIKVNLLDDLLVKMDIATMANSLESRSPFLDHKIMEFCASLPSNMKIKGMKLKYIIKRALSSVLPEEILSRNKMGFAVPLDTWFRGVLKDFSYSILMSDKALNRGYFKKENIKQLLDKHSSGKANYGSRIWSLLNLELWHRIFID
jgi:asparagine synthase (glutamine-hydrolysing)